MPGNNMRCIRIKSEFPQYLVDYQLLVYEFVVRSRIFFMCRLVFNKQSFERRHLIFPEKRRTRTEPQIPHQIPRMPCFFRLFRIEKRQSHLFIKIIEQLFPAVCGAVQRYFEEIAVCIHRYTAMPLHPSEYK